MVYEIVFPQLQVSLTFSSVANSAPLRAGIPTATRVKVSELCGMSKTGYQTLLTATKLHGEGDGEAGKVVERARADDGLVGTEGHVFLA